MPSLRDIRKRIRSVKNTQKITKAMKMVSAAKLRRAQERLVAARPYANALHDVVAHLAERVGPNAENHPLLRAHPSPKRVLLVVITSDRGLAGGFNSNVVRRAERFLWEEKPKYQEIRLAVIGRKGRDALKRTHSGMQEHVGVFDKLTYARAKEIADAIADEYVNENLDAAFLVYNEFKSAISQRVVIEQLLPVVPAGGKLLSTAAESRGTPTAGATVDYKYEPSQDTILTEMLPRYFATEVFRALLESVASEHGARMSAMDNATKNAGEMVGSLTLTYNRARQAYITKELMEIIGGAEALK